MGRARLGVLPLQSKLCIKTQHQLHWLEMVIPDSALDDMLGPNPKLMRRWAAGRFSMADLLQECRRQVAGAQTHFLEENSALAEVAAKASGAVRAEIEAEALMRDWLPGLDGGKGNMLQYFWLVDYSGTRPWTGCRASLDGFRH